MKILIADDEELVQYSLKSMIRELGIAKHDIRIACDGVELINALKGFSPDIAFVDIKMPRLNGLEAIKTGRDLSPKTRWIILTSYSSFEYAKEAIDLGAAGYLLKPVSPEELSATIKEVADTNRRELMAANEEFEGKLNGLFHNTISYRQAKLDFFKEVHFLGVIIIFDSPLAEESRLKHQIDFCNQVREFIGEYLFSDLRIALCTLPNGELVTAGAFPAENENGKKNFIRYLRRLKGSDRMFGADLLKVTILETEECDNYTMLVRQFKQAGELSMLRAVLGIGRSLDLEGLIGKSKQPELVKVSKCLAALSIAYRQSNYLEFMKNKTLFEEALSFPGWSTVDSVFKAVQLFLKYTVEPSLVVERDKDILSVGLKALAERLLTEKKKSDGSGDIVNKVKAFVEKNYMHDIGIAQIAYSLGITPNYLSALFHRKSGTTFLRYLTGVRMSRARELLAQPDSRVNRVAREVGYYSSRHFARLFKDHFNLYPSYCKRTSTGTGRV